MAAVRSLVSSPRRGAAVVAIAVALAALMAYVTGEPFGTPEPIEVVGGGPPDGIAPPVQDAEAIERPTIADDPCADLGDEQVSATVGVEMRSTGACVWTSTSGDALLTIETPSDPYQSTFADEANDWSQVPEVVSDPFPGLFFLDAERSALLIDGADSPLILRLVDVTRDRAEHLEALTELATAVLT